MVNVPTQVRRVQCFQDEYPTYKTTIARLLVSKLKTHFDYVHLAGILGIWSCFTKNVV